MTDFEMALWEQSFVPFLPIDIIGYDGVVTNMPETCTGLQKDIKEHNRMKSYQIPKSVTNSLTEHCRSSICIPLILSSQKDVNTWLH